MISEWKVWVSVTEHVHVHPVMVIKFKLDLVKASDCMIEGIVSHLNPFIPYLSGF